jgi:hypothetical protein
MELFQRLGASPGGGCCSGDDEDDGICSFRNINGRGCDPASKRAPAWAPQGFVVQVVSPNESVNSEMSSTHRGLRPRVPAVPHNRQLQVSCRRVESLSRFLQGQSPSQLVRAKSSVGAEGFRAVKSTPATWKQRGEEINKHMLSRKSSELASFETQWDEERKKKDRSDFQSGGVRAETLTPPN